MVTVQESPLASPDPDEATGGSPPEAGAPPRYVVEPMRTDHIPAVTEIESASFSTTWPASAYRREIERNQMAIYLVARRTNLDEPPARTPRFPVREGGPREPRQSLLSRLSQWMRGDVPLLAPDEAAELEAIVGYCGMWLMVDVAHITTIAVDPPYRGQGIGELMLVELLHRAREVGAVEATLECRVSNTVAQRLYQKYTFKKTGLRRRYYSDDGEDALIMTSEPLDSAVYRTVIAANRARLMDRLG